MKKYRQLFMLFLPAILFHSCQWQSKTELPKDKISSESKIDFTNSPKQITRTIKQDRQGHVWFATWEGMIKYDGHSFTNITSELSLSRFFSVLEDRNGNFWFGSIGSGVYHYDGKSFRNFTINDGLADNSVTYIYEDKKGNIWFATLGGASCYDGKSFRNFTSKEGLCNNDVNSILEDETGRFWFGTGEDACFYDGNSFTKIKNTEGHTFQNVRHIIEDKKGNVWLGGNDGLWRYRDNEFKNFTKDFIGYIYEDEIGNIWTSSNSAKYSGWALSRYDVTTIDNLEPKVTEIKAEAGMYFGILEDSNGNIWWGTLNGVYKYDGKTFQDFKADKLD